MNPGVHEDSFPEAWESGAWLSLAEFWIPYLPVTSIILVMLTGENSHPRMSFAGS